MSDPDHDDVRGAAQALRPRPLGLDDLLRSIHESVARVTRQGASQAMDHLLKQCFILDPHTGRAEPRSIKLPMPAANGTPVERDFPLYRLAQHRDATIEQLVVRIPVWLSDGDDAETVGGIAVSLQPPGDGAHAQAEIEVRFRGVDPGEGLERIVGATMPRPGSLGS
jgi:hypothetical protein